MNRFEKAMAAYNEIMSAPRGPDETGWTPPPRSSMRDKKWGKELRSFWLGSTTVRLPAKPNSTEASRNQEYAKQRAWAEENAQFYWSASNGLVWYFSDRNSALLFKLTFGGNVE